MTTSWERDEDIEKAFRAYFDNIYTTIMSEEGDIDQCIGVIEPRVTEAMNSRLNMDYTKEEAKEVLKQMRPLKSPGPDGFSVVFF